MVTALTGRPVSVDEVIRPLGASFSRQADTLLDLRESALTRARPGLCVACYFRLFGATRAEEAIARLCPLRAWLETQIEVVARDDSESVLETLPLRLEAEDLETYCRSVMAAMREDRAHPGSNLILEFRFKHAA